MFELDLQWLVVVAVGVSAVCVVALGVLTPRLFPAPEHDVDESWRDRPPVLFRSTKWLTDRLKEPVSRSLSATRRSGLQQRLNAAGLDYAVVVEEFVVTRWALVGCSVAFVGFLVLTFGIASLNVLAIMAVLPIAAYCYLGLWLRDQATMRRLAIEKDFPYFLDILVLSMKAGLAFPAAMEQSAAQLPVGAFKGEVSRLIRDVRTGHGRNEALARLARRVRIPAVSNFVAAVAQAEESGGALAVSLGEQARQRRRERFQRAEKLANQAPVKMLFPLVAFLFPVTFIIIGFPMYEQMSGSGFFG